MCIECRINATMADANAYCPFVHSTSDSIQSNEAPHFFPAAHPDTRADEHSCFLYRTLNLMSDTSSFDVETQQTSNAPQLQPLVMPQWPSMIKSQSTPTIQPGYSSQVQPNILSALQTPVSAASTTSASAPRKTLTDNDRRRICQHAEDHPKSKQSEIAGVYQS